jgi:hypothetical protein
VSDTPAARWRRLSTVALPLALVAVAVIFMLQRPRPLTGPPPAAIATAAADPCALFTSSEMGLLIQARIVERVYDPVPPRERCSYHGDAESAGTLVEVNLVSPQALQRERGRIFGVDDYIREATASATADPVEGLGDEAFHLPVGAGELWARDGDLLTIVTVARNGTEGDPQAAEQVAGVVLQKVAAFAPPSS